MFNKWLILVVTIVLAGVILMPEISASLARSALTKTHAHKSWAPGLAYTAAKINLRMWRYETAGDLLEQSIRTWPKELWVPEAHFQYALSQEKLGNGKTAINAYRSFSTTYPNHDWHEQARKRLSNIEANML